MCVGDDAYAYLFACRTGDSRGFAFVRYNYEGEAQDAVDGLDGERRENLNLFQSLRLSCDLRSHYSFWCREEGGWEGDHGAVCQVWAQF